MASNCGMDTLKFLNTSSVFQLKKLKRNKSFRIFFSPLLCQSLFFSNFTTNARLLTFCLRFPHNSRRRKKTKKIFFVYYAAANLICTLLLFHLLLLPTITKYLCSKDYCIKFMSALYFLFSNSSVTRQ